MQRVKLFLTISVLFGLCACNSAAETSTLTPVPPTSTQPVFGSTKTFIPITPSPLPAEPIVPIITPDLVQVEKWKEYQSALGNAILEKPSAICEWEILGHADQKVYVWAVCTDLQSEASTPAVIHLGNDGSILSVEFIKSWSKERLDKLFPANVQSLFSIYHLGRAEKLFSQLKWRQEYPDIPPLIIRSAATPEPTPTEWLSYNPNPTNEGCDEVFTATLPIKGTEKLSQTEIAQKLFEIFLGHFKSPKLGDICRLEDFKLEVVKHDPRIDFLAKEQQVDFVSMVAFSVQMKEVPNDWVAGNGEIAPNGWLIHKFLIIGVTKINNQYVLKLIGTGP